jgi:hypothetical protein
VPCRQVRDRRYRPLRSPIVRMADRLDLPMIMPPSEVAGGCGDPSCGEAWTGFRAEIYEWPDGDGPLIAPPDRGAVLSPDQIEDVPRTRRGVAGRCELGAC